MDLIIFRTVGLLTVAILVAIIARRIHLPYTAGLVVTSIGLAFTRVSADVALTHDLIFDLILPPLLFEAALAIHWKEFRRDALPILVLAIFGVVISAAAVAVGVVTILAWPVPAAIVFSVLIAATDPVSVIAMFKDTGIQGRLRLLVEGESLFNDGVAAVLFALALAWAQAAGQEPVAAAQIGQALLFSAGGGIVTGLVCGRIAIAVAGQTSDHLVETALTTVAAYGSFLLAEHFGLSGVLATIAAGMLMGNIGILSQSGGNLLSSQGREFVMAFWEFAAFIANSLVFLLIGLTVGRIPLTGLGASAFLIIIALVLIGRALTVYLLCPMFSRSRWAVPMAQQHILWWGGLRGALALALALALPPSLVFRNEILIATFGVVVFSVVVQGLTIPPLLRALALLPKRPRTPKAAR